MNEEIRCITNEGKTTQNEWENNISNFLPALYIAYQGNSFSILYPLTCLNKDTTVMLQQASAYEEQGRANIARLATKFSGYRCVKRRMPPTKQACGSVQ